MTELDALCWIIEWEGVVVHSKTGRTKIFIVTPTGKMYFEGDTFLDAVLVANREVDRQLNQLAVERGKEI